MQVFSVFILLISTVSAQSTTTAAATPAPAGNNAATTTAAAGGGNMGAGMAMTTTSSGSTGGGSCCMGSGATVPTKLSATCTGGASSDLWTLTTCSSSLSCLNYVCVVKALGVTASTTYYQACLTSTTLTSTMSAATTGSPSNGNTCYSGTTVPSSAPRLLLRSSVLWLVLLVSFSAHALRKVTSA